MCIRDSLFYHLQQAGTRVFCAECLLYVGVISQLAQQLKDDPVSYTHLDVYKRQLR